jgi:hypothetical protein
MFQQGFGGEGFAGDALDQFGSAVAPAVAVDFFAEPIQEGGEFTFCEHRIEIAEVLLGLFDPLGGVEVAEGVGGEVADAAAAPVDVL